MATIINTTPATTESNSGLGFLLGLLALLLIAALFFSYGLPALRNASRPAAVIPESVDINVNVPEGVMPESQSTQ